MSTAFLVTTLVIVATPGTGVLYKQETGPPKDTDAFNPDTDGDGFNDKVDKHPLDPAKH